MKQFDIQAVLPRSCCATCAHMVETHLMYGCDRNKIYIHRRMGPEDNRHLLFHTRCNGWTMDVDRCDDMLVPAFRHPDQLRYRIIGHAHVLDKIARTRKPITTAEITSLLTKLYNGE